MGRRRNRRKISAYLSKGDRVPRNYFIIPNAIFEKELSTEALVTLMYLLLHQKAEVSMVHLCAALGRGEETMKKYLQELRDKGITYPYQELKVSRKFFMLPKIIFVAGKRAGVKPGSVHTGQQRWPGENRLVRQGFLVSQISGVVMGSKCENDMHKHRNT